jgi:hypothetical protein
MNDMSLHERKTAEWEFLQLLCNADLEPSLRMELCAKLSPGLFTDPTNRIVFEEICRMSPPPEPGSAPVLREHLSSRVTGRGFPDVEFDDLLYTNRYPPGNANRRVREAYLQLFSAAHSD